MVGRFGPIRFGPLFEIIECRYFYQIIYIIKKFFFHDFANHECFIILWKCFDDVLRSIIIISIHIDNGVKCFIFTV